MLKGGCVAIWWWVDNDPMLLSLIARAGLPENASLAEVVEAVRSMPYGRPMERSAQGALAEWRGTCSTKHALLAAVLAEHWPHTEPQLVHRVYRCTPEDAARSFGPTAAAAVPEEGLWDVHRYLTIELNGNRVVIDITFPSGPGWDGASSMPVACGRGTDHAAGSDPDADKRDLEEAHCDPVSASPSSPPLAYRQRRSATRRATGRAVVMDDGCPRANLCLCLDGFCCYERQLALQLLDRTATPAVGDGL